MQTIQINKGTATYFSPNSVSTLDL